MKELGVEVNERHQWHIEDPWTHIEDIEQIGGLVRTKARDKMWQQLSRQRYNYQGLETSRDNKASDFLGKELKNPMSRNRWKLIQADGNSHTTEGVPKERNKARVYSLWRKTIRP